jgi:hypothetical protein
VVELPQRQQPGVAGKLSGVTLDNQFVVWEKIERQLTGSLCHHPSASCLG